MYQFISCIKLKPNVTVESFRQSLEQFTEHLLAEGLVVSVSPLGRRDRHPVMDTDEERDHEYFFTMAFADRAQCDRAVAYIYAHSEPGHTIHETMYGKILDPIFFCWDENFADPAA